MLSVIDLHAAGEQARGQRVCRIITTAKADSWQLLSTRRNKITATPADPDPDPDVNPHSGPYPGEPARVVVGGVPHVPGENGMEKRAYFMENLDGLRKALLLEPRGYPCQNANVLVPPSPSCPEALYGYIILEQNKIYPAMSGHNTICVATALLETGMVPMREPTTTFTLEPPGGPVQITATCKGGKVRECPAVGWPWGRRRAATPMPKMTSHIRLESNSISSSIPTLPQVLDVEFVNHPAFVHALDVKVDVPSLGEVTVDIAYGGMWYAVVDASSVGLELVPERGADICRLGEMIKTATREQHPVNHPILEYPGCDILVFRAPATPGSRADSRNAVVMSNGNLDWDNEATWTGMIDRSPCGTGTCAVMATLYARGQLAIGKTFVHEGILGTTFTGMLIEETTVGDYAAVVPTIAGRAWITQHAQVVCDPTDPFREGYTVGDIWAS